MANMSFFSYKRTREFLLFLAYISVIFLVFPISLGLFLSTLFAPLLRWIYNSFKIPYIILVLGSTVLFFYFCYICIIFSIDSFLILLPQLQHYLNQDFFEHPLLSTISTTSLTWMEQLSSFAVSTVQNIFHYIFELFIFLLAFYFSLFESKRNPYWFFSYVPTTVRTQWQHYYTRAMQLFRTFLFVELRLLLLTFLLLALGFFLLDFSHPLHKALLISVADCLPFFGIGIVLIPLTVYFFMTDQIILGFAIIFLYVFIQTTRQLTESYLWASTFHVRTIHTFIISAASVYLFGFYGILLSPFLLLLAVKIKHQPIFGR